MTPNRLKATAWRGMTERTSRQRNSASARLPLEIWPAADSIASATLMRIICGIWLGTSGKSEDTTQAWCCEPEVRDAIAARAAGRKGAQDAPPTVCGRDVHNCLHLRRDFARVQSLPVSRDHGRGPDFLPRSLSPAEVGFVRLRPYPL